MIIERDYTTGYLAITSTFKDDPALPPSELFLRLLGSPWIGPGGNVVNLPTKKLLGLVAYLALEGATSRSKLAGLFWSENDEESARRNLRRELHRLRDTPLQGYLHSEESVLRLHSYQTDVAQFRGLLEQGKVAAALEVYRGSLLEGLELPGATGFGEWLEQQREALRRLWQQALLYKAQNLETRGDWRGALEIHLQLLAQDSLQERHQREVMRLYYLLGEREAALERFERFRGTLNQELGLEPLPETLHLAEQIKAGRTASPKPTVAQTAGPGPLLQAPLIGREQVWQRIEAAWDLGQWVLIAGLAGVGKTRLLRDYALYRGKSQTYWGQPADADLPFATLSRALRAQLEAQPGLELPPWVRRELARLVPELQDTTPPPLRAQDERLRLYEAFALTMERAALNEGVVLCDDVQYFDQQSLEMLLFALERLRERGVAQPLLMAYRKGELRPEAQSLLHRFTRAHPGLELELEPLAESELLELIRRMSGSPEGRLFAQRLYRATKGNPFFVLETLKTLFESGLLRINPEGGWETSYDEATSNYRELPIPKNVREAVLCRVENLGEGTR